MANIPEEAILILVENLNLGRIYLITAARLKISGFGKIGIWETK